MIFLTKRILFLGALCGLVLMVLLALIPSIAQPCALCTGQFSDGLYIVNSAAAQIDPLKPETPEHPSLTLSHIQLSGIIGSQYHDTGAITLPLPMNAPAEEVLSLCRQCKDYLYAAGKNGVGLAVLPAAGLPLFLPVTDGAVYQLHGCRISITKTDSASVLLVAEVNETNDRSSETAGGQ